jgi:hypothetical protein
MENPSGNDSSTAMLITSNNDDGDAGTSTIESTGNSIESE